MSDDPQDDTVFGQWLRDNGNLERLPSRRSPASWWNWALIGFANVAALVLIGAIVWKSVRL